MTARCEVTDLLESECAHCRGPAIRRTSASARLPLGPPFEVEWPSACAVCEDPIRAGEIARFDADHDLICDGCEHYLRPTLVRRATR